jgi:hypothetical protein
MIVFATGTAMWRELRGGALVVLLALTAIDPTGAESLEAPPVAAHRAEYEVLRNGKPLGAATVELALVPGDARLWRYRAHTRGTEGLAALAGAEILEESTFRWRQGLPVLVGYRYDRQLAWRSRQRSLDVDEARATVHSVDGAKRYELRWDASVLDRQTVVLAIGTHLAGGADELRFLVADRDKLEWQRYWRAGSERLRVPAGEFEAIRIERMREKPGRSTTSWFAPALGAIPVRIEHREADGESMEMRLVRYYGGA